MIPTITSREEDVLLTVCEGGCTNTKELSKELFVTETTARTHLNNIYYKFRVNNVASLIYRYYKYELDYIVDDKRGRPIGSRKRT